MKLLLYECISLLLLLLYDFVLLLMYHGVLVLLLYHQYCVSFSPAVKSLPPIFNFLRQGATDCVPIKEAKAKMYI